LGGGRKPGWPSWGVEGDTTHTCINQEVYSLCGPLTARDSGSLLALSLEEAGQRGHSAIPCEVQDPVSLRGLGNRWQEELLFSGGLRGHRLLLQGCGREDGTGDREGLSIRWKTCPTVPTPCCPPRPTSPSPTRPPRLSLCQVQVQVGSGGPGAREGARL
jgi:hypothetical protein